MLKIYLCTVSYELKTSDCIEHISSKEYYVIKNEQDAVTKTIELSAYSQEAEKIYNGTCELHKKKKGCLAMYFTWDRTFYVKEWIEPDAKLIVSRSFKEESCSMKHLMTLPATDVIEYFKQEGLNFVITT